MKTRIGLVLALGLALTLPPAALMMAQQVRNGPPRPEGPCDVYAAARAPCVAAHSSTRALSASYNGPLYQVLRQSDGKTLDIGVIQPTASDPGGYAAAAAQDAFCANTTCWITTLYDQSGRGNHLTQAPHGGWAGPAMGGSNNLPVADMAPVTLMGHKVYGVFIEPGMGLRLNDARGTAVDDQAEGQYWVINGHHYNSGCCFDYGNGEIDSDNDGNGTMETTYFGNATNWYRGSGPGPWIMTDQENNLVGCANPDGSKNCANLPSITWRFVTATADGEPHHWRTMGADAQNGDLKIMFDGPRINNTYDPMRKQGAILLGNGGDNSNASQGTFYEGAMTAPNTFPSPETNQKLQANIVAARYDVPRLSVAPASAVAAPPGLQTFTPSSSQDTAVTFANTTGTPATGVALSLSLPAGWTSVVSGSTESTKKFTDPVAPGASVTATFKVTSGPVPFNGDLLAKASYSINGRTQTDTMAEKVRNVSPIKINEFASSFIELYNAGAAEIDVSNWTLTQHAIQQVPFSSIKVPAGTKLAPKGFYLLGLSNSGLAVPAKKGDTTLYVRSVTGMNVGDTIEIDTGTAVETRKIAALGTAAGAPPVLSIWGGNRTGSVGGNTIIWQPLPEGPVVTFPVGSTNVPVHNVTNFQVGQKIAIGYGTSGPVVARDLERYEVVTVTAVGKPGAQTYLAADAKSGDTSIRIRNAASLSVGDKIRLDIDSLGHGIESVTVKSISTAAPAEGGAMPGRGAGALGPVLDGDPLTFVAAPAGGAPGAPGATGTAPATGRGRGRGMGGPGGFGGPGGRGGAATTIELTAPLKFNHANNMPISIWGTGISFQPPTAFVHASNEPVLPLGTGITLDKPLDNDHAIDVAIRDPAATSAGYQGQVKPGQWFGGPVISYGGAMILRDTAGIVADSLNFGELVDPWAAEGYQAAGGSNKNGCRVPSPIASPGRPARGGPAGGAPVAAAAPSRSAGRTSDGTDTDSNCTDFAMQTPTPGAPNQR
jgi:non-reducing end alpha-L-arabinofuranosidase